MWSAATNPSSTVTVTFEASSSVMAAITFGLLVLTLCRHPSAATRDQASTMAVATASPMLILFSARRVISTLLERLYSVEVFSSRKFSLQSLFHWATLAPIRYHRTWETRLGPLSGGSASPANPKEA